MKAISGEILTRSRRDSCAMKDDLGEICNFSEIAMRSRRDERHLGEIKEISPRTLGDFARSR